MNVKAIVIRGMLSLLLALTVVATPRAWAQSDPPATPVQSDPQNAPREEDLEPGKGKISEFGDTLAKFWSISSAFQATQSFDDNVFMVNSFRKSDTLTKLGGRVTVAYRGQHTRFEASYLPEFNIYQRYDPLNYASHSYTQSFKHDFSRRLAMHWNLAASQAPSRGGLPFTTVSFGSFRFNTYSLEALNEGLNIFSGSNNVGMSYRFSPRVKVTANLDGAATRFTQRGTAVISPVSKELIYSVGGRVAMDYSLNARQTVGVALGHTYFGSVDANGTLGANDHQHHQTIRMTYSHQLPNGFSFKASAGPGFTERPSSPDPQVGVFFNVSVARLVGRTSYAVGFERSTQVGLLQDSITGYGINGRLRRDLGRKWTTNWAVLYHRAEGAGGNHQLESVSGNGQIGYYLTRHITPYLNYRYVNQRNLAPSTSARNVSRNEASIGFSYNFGVITGR
jgi:hypothetical protein